MFPWLFFAFVAIPLTELYLLVRLSAVFGLGATIILVVVTGFVGAGLARAQGLQALTNIQRDLQEGRMPAGSLLDGVLILAAGLLLVTPGLLTDLTGFLLLLPPARAALRTWIGRKLEARLRNGSAAFHVWRG
jgi:UPF0716 protein FxsA